MKKNFFVCVPALLFLVYVYSSCTKIDTTDLGGDLIPAVDNVNTFETTMNVIADNFYLPDSSRILFNEDHALGSLVDPVFGTTNAELYFSVIPRVFRANPFGSKDSIIGVDSVVLSLAFKGIYGDTTSTQRFQVFEIDQTENDRFTDSLAFVRGHLISSVFAADNLLGTHIQNFNGLNDSYKILEAGDTVTVSNQMRIRLDNNLAMRFINFDTSIYRNDSIFKTLFTGIKVASDGGFGTRNALAYFNVDDNNNTKVTFYYRAVRNGKPDTLATAFDFQGGNANHIVRTPAGDYAANINNADPDDELIYIQTSPGSYAQLTIPGLENLSNRVIHRAELDVEKVPSAAENIFTPPAILFLDAIDNVNNKFITIPNDFVFDFPNQFYNIAETGGIFHSDRYIFNLSRYVQSIVTRDTTNYTLRLYAPFRTNPTQRYHGGEITLFPPFAYTGMAVNTPIAKGRVVVAGGSYTVNPAKRMRLRIIYSKI